MRPGFVLPCAVCLVLLGACTEQSPTSPAASFERVPSSSLVSVGALRRATPQVMCNEGKHRDFDFWLGTWQISSPTGAPAGFNDIRSDLDGCVVLEHYSAGTYRGRSINMFDAATNAWFQTWVDVVGVNLRISGGLQGSDMVMSGAGPGGLNRITWTPLPQDRLRQHWQVSPDGGTTWATLFDGFYQSASIPAPAPSTGGPCGAPAYQAFNAWHGEWQVSADNGLELGRATIASDLNGCLNELRLTTDKGYQWLAFITFGRAAGRWFMTQMDSQGNRVQINGLASANGVVMTGAESGPGNSAAAVKVSFETVSANHLRQRWYSSHDGVDWREELVLNFVRP